MFAMFLLCLAPMLGILLMWLGIFVHLPGREDRLLFIGCAMFIGGLLVSALIGQVPVIDAQFRTMVGASQTTG